MRGILLVGLIVAAAPVAGGAAVPAWRALPDAPDARTEVSAAIAAGRLVVVGGFTAGGLTSARADALDLRSGRWSRLDDLPLAVNHAMATTDGRQVIVAGGYTAPQALLVPTRRVAAWRPGRGWRALPPMPEPRAAGGAAVVGGTLYVVGGIGPGGLAARTMALDLARGRWSLLPGVPTRREHLGAAALGGRVYVLGGRTGGFASNLATAEAYDTAARRWVRLPDMPSARGGTAAATVAGLVVSAGGEGTEGTYPQVEAFDPRTGRWRALPPSPAPRHGLGLGGSGARLYQAMGGPQPGLTVSATALELALPRP